MNSLLEGLFEKSLIPKVTNCYQYDTIRLIKFKKQVKFPFLSLQTLKNMVMVISVAIFTM